MLDMLDKLLEFLFSYGLFYAICLCGFFIVPLMALAGIKEHPDAAIGLSGIIILCTYYFCHSWVDNKANYCSVVVGALVFLVCSFFIPNILKASKIPFIITLLIYGGIAIYGF